MKGVEIESVETTKAFQVVAWGQTVGWARGIQFFIIDLVVVFDF